jgi:hypothetical protein
VIGTTLTISKSSQLINKPSDQKRLLNSEQIEAKSINSLVYATKVAKSLNTAIKNMCPICLSIISEALTSQQDSAAIPGGQKDK